MAATFSSLAVGIHVATFPSRSLPAPLLELIQDFFPQTAGPRRETPARAFALYAAVRNAVSVMEARVIRWDFTA